MKQVNKSDISVDMIREAFSDLFYNRVSPNRKSKIWIYGTEEEIKQTIETLLHPFDVEVYENKN